MKNENLIKIFKYIVSVVKLKFTGNVSHICEPAERPKNKRRERTILMQKVNYLFHVYNLSMNT